MNTKILIIGSKGMLGQELVKVFLVDQNYEVIGWDKEDIDVTREEQVKNKILPLAPQIIINAAAYNDVDKCEEAAEFEKAKELNGLAPGHLAMVAKELGAIFVHYSSDYVFDGSKKEGYRENDEPLPISNYGWSKLLGEKQVQQVGGHYYLIRLQKLFGWPAQSIGAKKSFFYNMLTLAKEKEKLEVVDEELSNFTYAPDLARQTKYLIEQGLPHGVYHITNEGAPITWYGAAKVLFEIASIDNMKLIPAPASYFPRPAKRPKYSILLNTKLPPLRPWPEALREFLGK
jgi:dTDP-4-dehydrorhamnose reductase